MFLAPMLTLEPHAPNRWSPQRTLQWRVRGGRRKRLGLISERSLNDLVLLVDERDDVPAGARLQPVSRRDADRHGFRCAIVRRSDSTPEGRRLLYVEILA